MKRFLLLLFSFCCLLVIAGCGGERDKDIIKVGISIPSADHGWTGGIVYWANRAKSEWEAKDPKVRVIVSTARDAAEQVDKVENLMVQGIDALVILPHEPEPLTAICEHVKKQGIYLVVVDRGLTKPVQDLLIAGDNTGFGRVGAEAIARILDGKGNLVVMEGIPCAVNSDRVNAFKSVMAKYPDIKILESQSAYWDPEKGLQLMENFLQKYPKIDAVWTGDDDVLLGALKAYEESKRKDVKLFVGGAGSKRIVKRIIDKDPLIPVNVTYPPKMIAIGVDYAIKGLRGESELNSNTTLVIPAEEINQTNAEEFYYPDSVF